MLLSFQGVRGYELYPFTLLPFYPFTLLPFYLFTFLPFNLYNVVSAMLSRQSSVLVVLEFLDRNEDG